MVGALDERRRRDASANLQGFERVLTDTAEQWRYIAGTGALPPPDAGRIAPPVGRSAAPRPG